jgi:hypothetical protein
MPPLRKLFLGASWPEAIFLVALVDSQVYYAYRYILKYSDPGTSGTYAATPQSWQVAKYALFIGFFIAVLAVILWHRTDRRIWRFKEWRAAPLALAISGLALLLLLLTIAAAASSRAAADELVKAWFFLPLLALVPLFWRGRRSLERMLWAVALLLGYHIVYEAVQLSLYYADGRLPALAYAGTEVRFGAGLDDPNGFGQWLVLPMLLLFCGWPQRVGPWLRAVLLAVMVGMLLETISFTAGIALAVGVLAAVIIAQDRSRALLAALAVVISAVAAVLDRGLIRKIDGWKSQSIAQHTSLTTGGANSVEHWLLHTGIGGWLFGSPIHPPYSEIAYIWILVHFGILALIAIVAMIGYAIVRGIKQVRLLRRLRDHRGMLLYSALTAWVIGAAVANLGTPTIPAEFPTNLMFWAIALVLTLPLIDPGGAPAQLPSVAAEVQMPAAPSARAAPTAQPGEAPV